MNDLVEKEIIRGLNELSKDDSSSDEYYKRLESIRKLHDIRIAETNLYYKIEEDDKRKEDRMDKWIGYGIDLIGIILPIGFYGIWMARHTVRVGTLACGRFRGHDSSRPGRMGRRPHELLADPGAGGNVRAQRRVFAGVLSRR